MTELDERAIEIVAAKLRSPSTFPGETATKVARELVTAYLSALPEQEPVAWLWENPKYGKELMFNEARDTLDARGWTSRPLYLASPVAHPLRDEEVERLTRELDACQKQAVNYEMITRLMEAVEGECDGLAIDAGQALAILSHVMGAEAAEAKLAALQPDLDAGEQSPKLRVTGFRGNPLRVVLSSGGEATISQKLIDSFASPSPFEQHPDDVAVDRFAVAMKSKLAKKRADGAGGWDDPEVCHIDYLAHLLAEQIHSRAALDVVDIGNFAMMIFNRGEKPSHGR